MTKRFANPTLWFSSLIALLWSHLVFCQDGKNTSESGNVDGVQRLDGNYLVQPYSWINSWTTKSIPKLEIYPHTVVFVLAVTKKDALQWFVISENRPTRKEIGDPLPNVVDFTVFFGYENKKPLKITKSKVDTQSVLPILIEGWALVRDPPIGSQEINGAIGFNEEWLLLCRKWKDGKGATGLHSGYGLNPPKGGKLPTIWQKLESLSGSK